MRSILSDIVSASADKANKTRSDQRHHASADDKRLEKWKLNHPWLIVVQTDSGVRLKCSLCCEAKVNSIWAEEGSGNIQGPVVQSIVSLTSSLRVISLTVLADSVHNILIFFAEKM